MELQHIITEIDELKGRYEGLFESVEDIKALQGIERCLEMKIKLSPVELKREDEGTNGVKISLSELPTKLLEEIFNTINSKKMKQQL